MSVDLLRIEAVTDFQLVPELAHVADLAIQPDGFYAFHNRYARKSLYEETVDRLTAAIGDRNSYVFRAVLTTVGEDGTRTEQLVGMTQWYVGYLIVPKVDPFAPKLSQSRRGNVSDVSEVASAGATGAGSTVRTATKIESGTSPNPFDAVARETGNSLVRAIRGKRHICMSVLH